MDLQEASEQTVLGHAYYSHEILMATNNRRAKKFVRYDVLYVLLGHGFYVIWGG